MAIKRRSSAPTAEQQAPVKQKLEIVAKPKRPMPGVGRIPLGADAPNVRRIGAVAASICNPTDELTDIDDYVKAMRTPFDPKNPQEVRYRNRVRNRGTAITAMCITCQGGRKAVTECIDTRCPLWAFRFGSDPFFGKRG